MAAILPVRVEVTPSTDPFTNEPTGYMLVQPVYAGVDRPITSGVTVAPKLVARLTRAIMAGAAYPGGRVATDVNGQTYVATGFAVMGRRMAADLKRLGF